MKFLRVIYYGVPLVAVLLIGTLLALIADCAGSAADKMHELTRALMKKLNI